MSLILGNHVVKNKKRQTESIVEYLSKTIMLDGREFRDSEIVLCVYVFMEGEILEENCKVEGHVVSCTLS